MTKNEHIELIRIAGELESVQEALAGAGELAENVFIGKIICEQLAAINGIHCDILHVVAS